VEAQTETEPTEFVGFGPAAEYLGLKRNTLSSYVTKGFGPPKHADQVEGQYVLPVFLKADLDEWASKRPGQGARTDLYPIAESTAA
jgi:hypothetical protein